MLPQGLPGHLVLRCSTVEMQCARWKPLTCSLTRHCARDHYVDLSVCPLCTLKCQCFLVCMTGNHQSGSFWWGKLCMCVCEWDRSKKEKEIGRSWRRWNCTVTDFREEEVWAAVSEEVKGEWKDLTHSWRLLIKSSLLDYVLCRRYGDFNLSKLTSPFSTGGWNVMQETVMRPHTY